jgi:hypothetical protein
LNPVDANGSSARGAPKGSLPSPNALNVLLALAGKPNGSGKAFIDDVT